MIWRIKTPPVWLVPALMSAVALMVVVRLMLPLIGSRAPDQLRDARVEEQEWRKRVLRLQQWQSAPTPGPAPQTLEDVRLSVLESLDEMVRLQQRLLDRVDITQSVMLSPSGADDSRVETLRVSFAGQFAHTDHLLGLFERLRQDVPNWPAEVRGCAIDRLIGAPGIDVACLYDIYHWTDPLIGGAGVAE